NLLTAGKLIATTYITNSAYRLHPIEWAIGCGAGTAAGVMFRDGQTNCDILELPALRGIQNAVVANSPISWAAYDAEIIPPKNGDLIVNDLQPIANNVPFRIEVYHRRAV